MILFGNQLGAHHSNCNVCSPGDSSGALLPLPLDTPTINVRVARRYCPLVLKTYTDVYRCLTLKQKVQTPLKQLHLAKSPK